MTCKRCHHVVRKFGTYGKRKLQRYRCIACKITFSEPAPKLGRHYTPPETAAKVLSLMLEGMSVRAIERFTGLHRDTILSLMNTAAAKARAVLDSRVQHIAPRFVQMDEMWGYVHTREPNLNESDPDEWGSTMVWLALDSETKLIITHRIGPRNGINATPLFPISALAQMAAIRSPATNTTPMSVRCANTSSKTWTSPSCAKYTALALATAGMAAAKLSEQSHMSKSADRISRASQRRMSSEPISAFGCTFADSRA